MTNGETSADIRGRVQEFYDSVGWKEVSEGVYQNARYEDLRPVSREYIQRCHHRLSEHIPPQGRYLLDAGSGPIQYPAYLEYSSGYDYRVCLDISSMALKEARKRIGKHGLYVVGDVANLPFGLETLDAAVSLHTIHHVPLQEQEQAFRELLRVLKCGGTAVAVYNWGEQSSIGKLSRWIASAAFALRLMISRLRLRNTRKPHAAEAGVKTQRTYVEKHDACWAASNLGDLPGFEIRVWRTVSVPLLKAVIHPALGGKLWLKLLYALEQLTPHFLGRHGTYPMLLFRKPGEPDAEVRQRSEA